MNCHMRRQDGGRQVVAHMEAMNGPIVLAIIYSTLMIGKMLYHSIETLSLLRSGVHKSLDMAHKVKSN